MLVDHRARSRSRHGLFHLCEVLTQRRDGFLERGKVLIALLTFLLAVSATAIALRKKQPWLLIGWLWYLGMLVPVIGLVQSGELAQADRYTYLPQIGLYLALTWTVVGLCSHLRHRRMLLGGVSLGIIAALALAARRQTYHWQDTEALWSHAIACNPSNALAYEQFGVALKARGSTEEARAQFEKALEIDPDYQPAHNNLGLILLDKGRISEAVPHFQRVLQINPQSAIAHHNMGTAFLQTGQLEEAIDHLKKTVEIKPDFSIAQANLANAFYRTGRVASAIDHYRKALEIAPDYAKARGNLGSALLDMGQPREAIAVFEKTLEIQPDYHIVRNNLAWVLATYPDSDIRDGTRAVVLAEEASKAFSDKNAFFLRTLAAAYAEAGRFDEAVESAGKALELAKVQSNKALSETLQSQIQLYQSHSPFHEAR